MYDCCPLITPEYIHSALSWNFHTEINDIVQKTQIKLAYFKH